MTAEVERRQVTYYHVPFAPISYHTDRFCSFLTTAREADMVVEHRRKEMRAGDLLDCEHVLKYRAPALKRCPRCGR